MNPSLPPNDGNMVQDCSFEGGVYRKEQTGPSGGQVLALYKSMIEDTCPKDCGTPDTPHGVLAVDRLRDSLFREKDSAGEGVGRPLSTPPIVPMSPEVRRLKIRAVHAAAQVSHREVLPHRHGLVLIDWGERNRGRACAIVRVACDAGG